MLFPDGFGKVCSLGALGGDLRVSVNKLMKTLLKRQGSELFLRKQIGDTPGDT